MRMLILLLLTSQSVNALAAPKKKAEKDESLRLWDGSDPDVAWVDENTLPPQPRKAAYQPWLSFGLGAGHRLFKDDTLLSQKDSQDQTLSEGRFLDLIEPGNSFEFRTFLHLFSYLSLGALYHVDEGRFKINNQSVAINPQELSGSIQVGPRFGSIRLYGFYNHIISSRSTGSIHAPTLVSDRTVQQTYELEIKQKGGEAGLGTQIRWGHVGVFAEAIQSAQRRFELNIQHKSSSTTLVDDQESETRFHVLSKPTFKAWQLGLTLDF